MQSTTRLLLLLCCLGIISGSISCSKCSESRSSSSHTIEEGYKCGTPNNPTSHYKVVPSPSQIVPVSTASATVEAPSIALARPPTLTSSSYATGPQSYVVMSVTLSRGQTIEVEPTNTNDVLVPIKSLLELGITLLTIVLGTSVSITCIACYLFKCRTRRTEADPLLFNKCRTRRTRADSPLFNNQII